MCRTATTCRQLKGKEQEEATTSQIVAQGDEAKRQRETKFIDGRKTFRRKTAKNKKISTHRDFFIKLQTSPVKKASIWVSDVTPGDVFIIQRFQTIPQLIARGSNRQLKQSCPQVKQKF